MRSILRRLEKIETKAGHGRAGMPACIFRSLVTPGPDGPVDLGPQVAHILQGPNAGKQLVRVDAESAVAFQGRCDAMLRGEQ